MLINNYPAIAAKLLSRARENLISWLPGGKFRGEEFVVGDLRGNPGESLIINILSGKWMDFSTGERGHDLLDLYAAINNMSRDRAAKRFKEVKVKRLPDFCYETGRKRISSERKFRKALGLRIDPKTTRAINADAERARDIRRNSRIRRRRRVVDRLVP